ncbi:hypothetical protein CDL15_Pgr005056 [Punica granatum]|uniref:Uncharacterized protein n=1 Tax=Punica granatum TaxID=22663 RepID=A0A218W277_PUNGR|nr:hypothetical protein CDL15_Pgr005056 [Punica granatum]
MFYLASGCKERVGEVFESRVTRLNAWKGAREQRMHVRARMGARLGLREHTGGALERASVLAGASGARTGVMRAST